MFVTMVYRADFYTSENIIGYTGSIQPRLLPSIYFYDRIHAAFGCITQNHNDPNNIGREPVLIDRDYVIFNLREGDPFLQSSRILNTGLIQATSLYMNNIGKHCMEVFDEMKYRSGMTWNTMVECYCCDVRHISRNELKTLKSCSDFDKELLFSMIHHYQYLKPKFWDVGNLERDYTGKVTIPDDKPKFRHIYEF